MMNYYIVLFSNNTKSWNIVGTKCDINEVINAEETQLNGSVDNVKINLTAEQVNKFVIIHCKSSDLDSKLNGLQKLTDHNDIFNGVEWIIELFNYTNDNNNAVVINGEGLHYSRCCFNANVLKFNKEYNEDNDAFASNFSFSLN